MADSVDARNSPDAASPQDDRRSLLKIVAGTAGLFVLGAPRALGQSLLILGPVPGDEEEQNCPPETESYTLSETQTFTLDSGGGNEWSTDSITVSPTGSGTLTVAFEAATHSFSYTWLTAYGGQDVTMSQTDSVKWVPPKRWTQTYSYSGASRSTTIYWPKQTHTAYRTASGSFTYTVPGECLSVGGSEIRVPARQHERAKPRFDLQRPVLDPSGRSPHDYRLALGL